MKGEAVSEDVVTHFMLAFEILVKSNLSQEVMRSLSLFITYAFHTPPASNPRTPKASASISRPTTPGALKKSFVDPLRVATPPAGTKFLTRRQLGTRVLAMYSRILCEKGNMNHIKKFARTVTNKVRQIQNSSFLHLTVGSGYCTSSPTMMPKSSYMVVEFWPDFWFPMGPATRQNLPGNLVDS